MQIYQYIITLNLILLVKNVKTQDCQFQYGRGVGEFDSVRGPNNTQLTQAECILECQKLQKTDPTINGVTTFNWRKDFCRCQKKMNEILKLYSCKISSSKETCTPHEGELLPEDSKIVIQMSEPDIPSLFCVKMCNDTRANNNTDINGVTVNGLNTTTICWCNIKSTSRRNHQTCYIGKKYTDPKVNLSSTPPSSSTTTTTTTTTTTAIPESKTLNFETTSASKTSKTPNEDSSNLFDEAITTKSACSNNGRTECSSEITDIQKIINDLFINETHVKTRSEVSKKIRRLVHLFYNVVDVSNQSLLINITPFLIKEIDTIIGSHVSGIMKTNDMEYFTSSMLTVINKLLEKLAFAISLQSSVRTIKVNAKNVAIYVTQVNHKKDLFIHTTFIKKLSIQITTHIMDQSVKDLSVVTIPKYVLLPHDTISCVSYRTSHLFPLQTTSMKVGSVVQDVTIGSRKIENLQSPITLDFTKFSTSTTDGFGVCSFWYKAPNRSEVGYWSTSGCVKVNETENRTICQCDHLTNFAVLFDISQTGYNPVSLQVITRIGCILSLLGLLPTVVVYLIMKNLRRKLQSKILINLCCTMIALLVTFLFGAEKTTPRVGCQVVAGLIHYFLLSMFCWMAVEGFNLYQSIVVVFKSRREGRLFKIFLAIAYGVPLVVVAVNAVFASHSLGDKTFCVLHGRSFYFSLLMPILGILLINFGIFAITLFTIQKSDKTMARTKTDHEANMKLLRMSFSCACIMGLTWIFGALAIGHVTITFQWIFSILNSLQGFFIFVFHTVRNKEVIIKAKKILTNYERKGTSS